ncbi:MAG TPA: 4'-phosphopantetheinyl transferase superfamily protein [Dermatophilaceae bacterium]|nr:4'-phosphopantetheinyl transferase superfamily protein [Dermatophilaceae bacterium]
MPGSEDEERAPGAMSERAAGVVRVHWRLAAPGEDPSVARALLRAAVAARLGIEDGDVRIGRSCPGCGSADHGRPVLLAARAVPLSLSLSLARAPGLVAAATSDAGPVGIDVEAADRTAFDGFADVALHPAESAATPGQRARTWARKEAVLKAAGAGLRVDPRLLVVTDPASAPAVRSGPGLDPDRLWLTDLDLPAGYAGCLALAAPAPAAVVVTSGAATRTAGGAGPPPAAPGGARGATTP